MKNFTRKKAEKYIEKTLNTLKEQGFNISNVLKGKSVKSYAWSNKALDQFKKYVKREKERPAIIEEVKSINERIKYGVEKVAERDSLLEEKKRIREEKEQNRNIINERIMSIAKHNLDMDINQENIEYHKESIRRITSLEADNFFNKYFKSVSGVVEIEEKLEKLKARFGSRLDLLHDFIDKVCKIDFKYEIDGVVFSRETFENDYADNWNDMMSDRIDKMFSILNTKEFRI